MEKYSKNLSFSATYEQKNALESLQYWIAELHYLKKHGGDEFDFQKARKTIELCCFPKCDRLSIPYWVQNAVIAWAENGRYEREYFSDFLRSLA